VTRAVLSLIAIATLAACSSSSEPAERFVAEEEGFSIAAPAAWTHDRDRGAILFTSPDDARRTLAIRSVVIADPVQQRKALDATRIVVEALPDVRVTSTRPVDGAMRGVAYELTFVPPGSRERYARTHVVLVGDQHVYHVIETQPARGATATPVAPAVAASLREEG
jgi:hypothetical protein